jgi:hypothetical protein
MNTTNRIELYRLPHKALRLCLTNVLVKMGRASFDEPTDVDAILADLALALWACDDHIAHEDTHVRPALAERASSTLATLDAEHTEHARQVAELRAIATSLRDSETAEDKTALGATLYLHFSVFVAETLAHMAYEERVVQTLLDRLFSTEELEAIHQAILASIPPQQMIASLRLFVPAINPAERAELLGGVKAGAPPQAFAAVLQEVRPLISVEDWADLGRRLAL